MMHRRAMTEATERGIAEVEKEHAQDLICILFTLGYDWEGDPAIFFRILLPDKVAKDQYSQLLPITQRIQFSLRRHIDSEELGFHTYFNYRTASEQAKLKDPDWEPTAHPEATGPEVSSIIQPRKDCL